MISNSLTTNSKFCKVHVETKMSQESGPTSISMIQERHFCNSPANDADLDLGIVPVDIVQ
jgi:hypothetical protein